MKGVRCRHCHRWFGRHRTELVADGRTDDTCAFRALYTSGGTVKLSNRTFALSAPIDVRPDGDVRNCTFAYPSKGRRGSSYIPDRPISIEGSV